MEVVLEAAEYLDTMGFSPAQANLVGDLDTFLKQTGCDARSFGLAASKNADLFHHLRKRRVSPDTVAEVRRFLVDIGGPVTMVRNEDGRTLVVERKPGDPVSAKAHALRIMKENPPASRGRPRKVMDPVKELARVRAEISALQEYEQKLLADMHDNS